MSSTKKFRYQSFKQAALQCLEIKFSVTSSTESLGLAAHTIASQDTKLAGSSFVSKKSLVVAQQRILRGEYASVQEGSLAAFASIQGYLRVRVHFHVIFFIQLLTPRQIPIYLHQFLSLKFQQVLRNTRNFCTWRDTYQALICLTSATKPCLKKRKSILFLEAFRPLKMWNVYGIMFTPTRFSLGWTSFSERSPNFLLRLSSRTIAALSLEKNTRIQYWLSGRVPKFAQRF